MALVSPFSHGPFFEKMRGPRSLAFYLSDFRNNVLLHVSQSFLVTLKLFPPSFSKVTEQSRLFLRLPPLSRLAGCFTSGERDPFFFYWWDLSSARRSPPLPPKHENIRAGRFVALRFCISLSLFVLEQSGSFCEAAILTAHCRHPPLLASIPQVAGPLLPETFRG